MKSMKIYLLNKSHSALLQADFKVSVYLYPNYSLKAASAIQ